MILYIGNKLGNRGFTPSSVDVLGPLLAERFTMVCVSDKVSMIFRWVDIVLTILRNRKRARLILIDTYSARGFYFAMTTAFLARRIGVPYLPILHGGNLESRLRHSQKLSHYIFGNGNAFKLVAPSNFLFSVFEKYGYTNLTYIPNSLPVGNYPFIDRQEFSPRLLWVRSFNKVYNPEMAIRVLINLRGIFPTAKLCMVGPEKDRSLSACKELAESEGVREAVEFTGKLTKTEWHQKAAGYDFFINTPSVDNTPVSILEAMALGLPVISTRVGGIPYLLDDGEDAVLVNENEADEMASKITELIQSPAKARAIAQTARRKVERFDWQIVKEQWFNLIDHAIQ